MEREAEAEAAEAKAQAARELVGDEDYLAELQRWLETAIDIEGKDLRSDEKEWVYDSVQPTARARYHGCDGGRHARETSSRR
jgi:hypothetical protein